jgi:four helix bundle protein
MMTYEKLDAWKVSHDLVLAVWRATEKWSGPDGECLRDELRSVALLAPSKLANGSGRLTRKSFQRCVDLALGYLIELGYLLQRGEEMGLLTGVRRRELDAVRGRAVFYTTKLFVSLTDNSETGPEP